MYLGSIALVNADAGVSNWKWPFKLVDFVSDPSLQQLEDGLVAYRCLRQYECCSALVSVVWSDETYCVAVHPSAVRWSDIFPAGVLVALPVLHYRLYLGVSGSLKWRKVK